VLNGDLIRDIAIGLVTAGITSIIFEFIIKNEFVEQIKTCLEPNLKIIGLRENMSNHYIKLFNVAKNRIDIIALTSENLIKAYGTQLLEKIKHEYCEIRILILNPESELWDYRIKNEPGASRELVERHFSESEKFYKNLKCCKSGENKVFHPLGSLIVKTHNNIPYFAYFRADDETILGLYYSYTVGIKSHAISVSKKDDMFNILERHFNKIWEDSSSQELINISYYQNELAPSKQSETTVNS
jgi:hypothetical protein